MNSSQTSKRHPRVRVSILSFTTSLIAALAIAGSTCLQSTQALELPLPRLDRTIKTVENYAAAIAVDTGDRDTDNIITSYVHMAIDRYKKVYDAPIDNDELSEEKNLERLTRFYSAVLSRHDAVDIYIFKHTNSEYRALQKIPLNLRKKLRLVYNSGCLNERDASTYLALGIEAFIGHRGISSSPVFGIPFMGCFAGTEKLLTIPLPFLTGDPEPLKECVMRGNRSIRNIFSGDEASFWDNLPGYISNLQTGKDYTPAQIRESSYGHLYGSSETRLDQKREINESDLSPDFDFAEGMRKNARLSAYLRSIADQNEIDYAFASEAERQKQLNVSFQRFLRLFQFKDDQASALSDEEKALFRKNSYNGVVAFSNFTGIKDLVSGLLEARIKRENQRAEGMKALKDKQLEAELIRQKQGLQEIESLKDPQFLYRFFAGRLATRMHPEAAAEWTRLLFKNEMTPDLVKQVRWAAWQVERLRDIYREQNPPPGSYKRFETEEYAYTWAFFGSRFDWNRF